MWSLPPVQEDGILVDTISSAAAMQPEVSSCTHEQYSLMHLCSKDAELPPQAWIRCTEEKSSI